MPETSLPLPLQRKGWSIPEKIEEYLDDPGTESAILDILMRHQVKERESIENAVDAVVDVFEGKLHPNELIQKFVKTTGFSQGQAQQLAVDISKKIFTPVRTELLAMYRGPGGQQITSNLQPVTTPTGPAPARQPITSNLRPLTPVPGAVGQPIIPMSKPFVPPTSPAVTKPLTPAVPKPFTPQPSSAWPQSSSTRPQPSPALPKPSTPSPAKTGDVTSTAHLVTPQAPAVQPITGNWKPVTPRIPEEPRPPLIPNPPITQSAIKPPLAPPPTPFPPKPPPPPKPNL